MADSVRQLIQAGIAARVATITSANGYDTDVQKVFFDEIPMGLQLEEHQMPAVLIIAGDDDGETNQQCWYGDWNYEFQLWHNDTTDATMDRFVRDFCKAIYANSATAKRQDAWRGPAGIHESLFDVVLKGIETDLNMIEANRLYFVRMVFKYTSNLYNL